MRAGRITRQNPQGLNPDERNVQRELRMHVEPRVIEAQEMAQAAEGSEPPKEAQLTEQFVINSVVDKANGM